MRALAASLVLLAAPPAAALPVAGLDVPERVDLSGHQLRLNGAGVRHKLFLRIYLCALYLEEPSSDPAAILARDGAWKVTMRFLRHVTHHQVLEAFTEAFEHNSPGQLAALTAELEKFHAVLHDLRNGEELVLSYLPGTGTRLEAPGGEQATVAGKPFADAMLRTFIGDQPSDRSLKAQLLGERPPG